MRGKQAARAANQRAEVAQEKITELRERLHEERGSRAIEVQGLKDQIGELKNSLVKTAGQLAADEIARLTEELAQAQAQISESQRVISQEGHARDYLMRSMAHFVSLTEGIEPSFALARVIVWLTDERVYYSDSADALIERVRVPHDGWVAKTLRQSRRAGGADQVQSHPLSDVVENLSDFPVHPKYVGTWYAAQPVPRLDGASRKRMTVTARTHTRLIRTTVRQEEGDTA